jgi:hypothetical protein
MLNFECSMFNGKQKSSVFSGSCRIRRDKKKQKAEVIQLHSTISMTFGQLKGLVFSICHTACLVEALA